MISSIYTALSGMLGYQRGLNVISNNVSNMNTPGFRGSSVSFNDVFIGNPQSDASNRQLAGQQNLGGAGLDASRTVLDLRAGETQQTGRDLDLLLSGDGYFVVQDEAGNTRYTRNGNFDIVDGQLVMQNQKIKVMTRNASGQLVPLNVATLELGQPKSTTEVAFSGSLAPGNTTNPSPTPTEKVLDPVTVFDSAGGQHNLRVVFTLDTTDPVPPGASVNWKITVQEGTEQLATGNLPFNGSVVFGSSSLTLNLALKDAAAADISFNFDAVNGLDIGDSNVQVLKQDGFAPGTVSTQTFDEKGLLKLTYSNGQTANGPKLVLAQIRDDGGLVMIGNSLLAYEGTQPIVLREAGDDLKVQSQALERSNVDLTTEFSELILMQRGYQASSQVVSTANDMMQELLQMKGGK